MSTERPRATACIFCMGTPLTKEHIVGDWITRLLVDADPDDTWSSKSYVGGPVERRREHPAGRPEVVRKIACKPCNEGWMSELQGRAKPLLQPMVEGNRRVLLDLSDQVVLATWAAMTSICYEWWEPVAGGFVFSTEARQRLRENRTPPHWLRVQLAFRDPAHNGIGVFSFVATSRRSNQASVDVTCTTFALGHAVVQVYGGPPFGEQLGTSPGPRLGSSMLWPPTMPQVIWPTAPITTEEALYQFAKQPLQGMSDTAELEAWRQRRNIG